jgi:hypothetical protein
MVLLRAPAVAEKSDINRLQEQASAKPKTVHGLSADPRPDLPEAAVRHPRLFAQARALVAAKVAGETIVRAIVPTSFFGSE